MKVWVQVWDTKYGTDIGVFHTEEGAIEGLGKAVAGYPDDVICDEARAEFKSAVESENWDEVIRVYFDDQNDHEGGESYLIEEKLVYP